MNEKQLKIKMLEYGDTQTTLAKALDIDFCTLNYKINGRSQFKQNEIGFIAKRYKLSAKEIQTIFFSKEVR